MFTENDINRIGKAWMIVYSYNLFIDKTEQRYKNISTYQMRINIYNKISYTELHSFLLKADVSKYNTNELGVSINELEQMRQALINRLGKIITINFSVHINTNIESVSEYKNILTITEKCNMEIYEEYNFPLEKSNLFIYNIKKGSFIIEFGIAIACGILANVVYELFIKDYVEKLKEKLKEKLQKKLRKNKENGNIDIYIKTINCSTYNDNENINK